MRTLVGVLHFLKSVEFDIGTSPELEEVEYAYQTPSELRMIPGSGKSLLMTAPCLTVRFIGVASERVVTTPRRVRTSMTGSIIVMGEGRERMVKLRPATEWKVAGAGLQREECSRQLNKAEQNSGLNITGKVANTTREGPATLTCRTVNVCGFLYTIAWMHNVVITTGRWKTALLVPLGDE